MRRWCSRGIPPGPARRQLLARNREWTVSPLRPDAQVGWERRVKALSSAPVRSLAAKGRPAGRSDRERMPCPNVTATRRAG